MTMDGLAAIVNALVSAVLCAASGYAVVSPRVRDGILAKIGLVAISIGFGVSAVALMASPGCDGAVTIGRAHMMVHVGLLVVAAAWCVRVRRHRRVLRRASDFVDREDVGGPRHTTPWGEA